MSDRIEKAKKRIDYVDIAKGFGMLAVIWGHILTDYSNPSVVLVYAFDIPLFFVLAGMMYNGEKYNSFGKLLKSRAKSLLLPYVIFSVVTWIIWAAFSIVTHSDKALFAPLLQTVIAQGSGGFLVHNVPLWFVTCLFVVEVLYYFISKANDIINLLICIALAVVGHFMLHNNLSFDFTLLPWNIEAAMSAMLFYCVGNLFAKRFKVDSVSKFASDHKLLSLLFFAAAVVPFVFGALYNGHITLGSNRLGKSTVLLYAVGLIGTAAVILLSAVLGEVSFKPLSQLINGVKWIGRHSFNYMAVHVPIKGFIAVVLAKLLHTNSEAISETPWQALVVYVLSLIASTVIVVIIELIKKRFKTKPAADSAERAV